MRTTIGVLIAMIALALCSVVFSGGNEATLFSHGTHGEDLGMDCVDCHASATESASSSDRNLPEKDVCASCHDVEEPDECATCHPDLERAESFPNPKRSIIFSHSRHLEAQELSCAICHPDADDDAVVPPMSLCMRCHDATQAPSACALCHEDIDGLRPESHQYGWMDDHREEVRVGAECAMCHQEAYCQECHDGARLIESRANARTYDPSFGPRTQGSEPMMVEKVHDLNYRYTHGLDASDKATDCSVCHLKAAFCRTCHLPEGENFAGALPQWHGGDDWGAFATRVGSGGGRHAELARRDIERCAACHDVQGDDPACLLCHIDRTPGLGNDPQPHKDSFAEEEGEGEWHDDEGAVCFVCHMNTRTTGVGFCGYCHGARD